MFRKGFSLLFWTLYAVFGFTHFAQAQSAVYTEPAFPRTGQPVTVYFDARFGTGGLKDCNCTVYVHTGLITDQSSQTSDWKFVFTQWGIANSAWAMTPVAGRTNLYKFEIKPDIHTLYGAPLSTVIKKLAFVFRNAAGNKEGKDTGGKDFFLDVFSSSGLVTSMITPAAGSNLVTQKGNTIPFQGRSSDTATLSLVDNGVILKSVVGTALDYTIGVVASGDHLVEFVAERGAERVVTSFRYVVIVNRPAQDPPPGTKAGITRTGANSVRLAVYAPNKPAVFVTGNFNNWSLSDTFLMNRSVDGALHWMDIQGVPEDQSLFFQYVIENGRRMGDPYSELVLDPFDDRYISTETFPNLPAYPAGKAQGTVTWVRPKPAYNWKVTDFQKPAKGNLVVYELLLRDFIARHDYQTLKDTLDYLQRLGVTAIELMPVNEFEGNESWGYNPSYHMALDKYYGTPEAFKAFVDACHERGMAVILDVVYNHAFDQSPLAQLYWDETNRRPSVDNPWLNPTPKHDFNVGHDFNHESPATREFVKRVLRYWQQEYRVDGFRFDLSKGFTQKQTLGNSGLFAQLDPTRVAILKDYANYIWETDPKAYVIMEHFAENAEETELVNAGMMVWNNLNHDFLESGMGFSNNLSGLDYRSRGWSAPGTMSYGESHDEERMMYKKLNFGNQSPDGTYRVKDQATALARQELSMVFLLAVPGPRMIWQFGELGYDYSINTCGDGTVNGCRLANKPVRWDYRNDPLRQRVYDITRAMLDLRKTYSVFQTTDFRTDLGDSYLKSAVLRGTEFDVALAGNFGVTAANIPVSMAGVTKLYEYFTGDSITVTGGSFTLNYLPGQYRLFTTKRLPPPVMGSLVTGVRDRRPQQYAMEAYPNPVDELLEVRFTAPASGWYKGEIYDLMGKQVATLFDGYLPAGEHWSEWNSRETAPGTYLLRIQGEKGQSARLVVVQ